MDILFYYILPIANILIFYMFASIITNETISRIYEKLISLN